MIHVDTNGDCIYEPGEPLLAGVTVQLLNSNNQVVATTVTDQNGQYKFSNLQPGTYTVHEVQPTGYFEFGDSVGSAGGTLQGLDTIASATLGSGMNATDYDFCVQAPASISGMIHVDTNGDCIYEPGEPLLAGVTVQLINSSNQVVATTVTDQNGQYKFSNLKPGTYTSARSAADWLLRVRRQRRFGRRHAARSRYDRRRHARLGHERHRLRFLRAGAGLDLGHDPRRYQRRLHLRAGRAAVGRRHRATAQFVRTKSSPPPSPIRTASTSSQTCSPARTRFTKCSRRATSSSATASARPAAHCRAGHDRQRYARLGRERHGLRFLRAGAGHRSRAWYTSTSTATASTSRASRCWPASRFNCSIRQNQVVAHHGHRSERPIQVRQLAARHVYGARSATGGLLRIRRQRRLGRWHAARARYDRRRGLGSGANATDYDFCVQTPPTISGMVHVDLNGDCIYEPGEPLLAGVTDSVAQFVESGGRHHRHRSERSISIHRI